MIKEEKMVYTLNDSENKRCIVIIFFRRKGIFDGKTNHAGRSVEAFERVQPG